MATRTLRPATDTRTAWRRLGRIAAPRMTRSNLFVLALAVLLGFAISAQVRQTRTQGLENLRQEELVGILDTVTQESVRLGNELRDLERTRDRLASGADSEAAAVQVAQERADTLAILAGTKAATGPGITMTITDPDGQISSTILLDALEELRDAGAEVIQIGPVRVVASTYFTDVDGGISVSGTNVAPPYIFRAIGDAPTMAAAMEIPGGVGESVRGKGGEVTIAAREEVSITATYEPKTPQFARPAPTPSSSASS